MVREPIARWHTTDGTTSLVAASALYRDDKLPKLAATHITWMTRGPATGREAQAGLAPADPQTMASRHEGSRAHELTSTDGGVEQRWLLMDSEPRQPHAPRTVDTPWRQQRDQEVNAFQP
jgi:hypothetical protein